VDFRTNSGYCALLHELIAFATEKLYVNFEVKTEKSLNICQVDLVLEWLAS
jgi:hypothetical protein